MEVHDVLGDGNCYYRCIWRIARTHAALAAALGLGLGLGLGPGSDGGALEPAAPAWEDDPTSTRTSSQDAEAAGMQAVRDAVAAGLAHDPASLAVVASVLEFVAAAGAELDITSECPLAAFLDASRPVAANCDLLAAAVRTTRLMASSVELEVVRGQFAEAGVGIITLTQLTGAGAGAGAGASAGASAGKREREQAIDDDPALLHQLRKAVAVMAHPWVCVLVNLDNVHYKYCTLLGRAVMATRDLARHCAHTGRDLGWAAELGWQGEGDPPPPLPPQPPPDASCCAPFSHPL